MRSSKGSNLGILAVIPFLFSMVAFSGVFLAASLSLQIAAQSDAETNSSSVRQQEEKADELERQARALQEQISRTREELALLKGTSDKQAVLASLHRQLGLFQQRLGQLTKQVTQLQDERSKLQDSLRALQELEGKVAKMRLSRTEIAERVKALQREINSIKQQTATVQREVDSKEQVQAKNLVPSGSLKPAVFVECDSKGIRIMPEGTALDSTASPAAREIFLKKAAVTGYVVFLIRPDGYTSFERYREIVETHNKTSDSRLDFGYEPVNAEWKLVYPEQ